MASRGCCGFRRSSASGTGEHYEGGHWLGTFAVYLTSEAGL
jgi:hypothetical protein